MLRISAAASATFVAVFEGAKAFAQNITDNVTQPLRVIVEPAVQTVTSGKPVHVIINVMSGIGSVPDMVKVYLDGNLQSSAVMDPAAEAISKNGQQLNGVLNEAIGNVTTSGTHTISVVVQDNLGNIATSSAVVQVTTPGFLEQVAGMLTDPIVIGISSGIIASIYLAKRYLRKSEAAKIR